MGHFRAKPPRAATTSTSSAGRADEGSECIKATYGADYERLAAVKNNYDPTNLLRRRGRFAELWPGKLRRDLGMPQRVSVVPLARTCARTWWRGRIEDRLRLEC